ncbi:dephospho-CoA kinase [Azotosporobacter soli]|uniref:dephospho-CoA kinase n=1 Tax=Azotosporobacter soli TaxID=3055040 RepID=UPI0031FF45D4
MIKIGLTGGIASGKSTVAGMLRECGIIVIDADEIAHRIMEPGQTAWQEIVAWLGREILTTDGIIDRRRLGDIIFTDPTARAKLEAITHPRIWAVMNDAATHYAAQGVKQVILDIPLLIECNWQEKVDEIWLVYASQQLQLERLQARNHLSKAQALARIHAQKSIEEKQKVADVIIDNSGDLAKTRAQIAILSARLLL